MSEKEDVNTSQSVVPLSGTSLPSVITVLPVYYQPIFPGVMMPISISADHLTPEIDSELKAGNFIGFFLVEKEYNDVFMHQITPKMIYSTGSIARIVKRIFLPNGSINLIVNCFNRVKILDILQSSPILKIEIEHIQNQNKKEDIESKVLLDTISKQMDFIGKTNPFIAEQIKIAIQNADSYSHAADFIASIITDVDKEKLQDILETIPTRDRLEKIAILLEEKLGLLRLQEELMEQINKKTAKQQKEFFLKEQLKAIQQELGLNTEPKEREYKKFLEQFNIIKNSLSLEAKESIEQELSRLNYIDSRSSEYSIIINYLDTVLSLPWKEKKPVKEISLKRAEKILNDRHYGLDDIKLRILEFIAVQKLKKSQQGSIICLVGPPGVGKTSLGKAIADALHKPFYRFSVGGMRDESEIKGHRKTYIGAMPGKIIQGLKTVKEKSPVFMIDEIDKMGSSHQGDPASALLEVLDPEQNISFRDHYLDIPFDISQILFITTANTLSTIPAPLLDRMEIIQLSGYIPEEKYMIGKNYLLEKNLLKNGLEPHEVTLTKKAYIYIVEKYSRESGIRNFEQQINKLCRKLAFKKIKEESIPSRIDAEDLKHYLGSEIFAYDETKRIKYPGTAIGLAWTSMGGDTLYIESILIPHKSPGIKLTGQLGDVMQESANIAYSYIQSMAHSFHIRLDTIKNHLIHLHVPAGAVPKDGPSAGITIATALFSLLTGKKVPQHFAMTGELTLTGSVLPIGGLKEKSIAAVRAGITHIIIPEDNKKDMEEIPEIIKKHLTYYPVNHFKEVLKVMFDES